MVDLIMKAALEQANAASSPQIAAVTHELCRILLLEELAAGAGWYLTEGLLTTEDIRGIPDQLTDACARLLPHVPTLTDMLDVPTKLIRSTIATDDYITSLAPPL
jgi:hypothetical protein